MCLVPLFHAHVIQSADEKAAQITEKFADVIGHPPAEARKRA